MAFIPAPEFTIRLAFIGTLDGEEFVNTLYVSVDSYPADAAAWVAFADACFDAYTAAWLDSATAHFVLREEVILNRVIARDVAVEDGAEGISTRAPFVGEGTAGTLLSNNVALCVTWRTGTAGRSFRGRMYLPGITSAALDGPNHITTGQASDAKDSADLFRDGIEAITEAPVPVIASYRHDNAPRALAVVTPIVSAAVNTRLDTQRRRLPRV